ncbi:MAG: peptidylprolyl isomerase [Anaeromicrobium sp.]|jgi:peptidylprolyl isomerase/peptidyl-prolyl cis-trans isomerase B (cyclophilin B)|uniref:peptidylprolyl isomerase n=1 Tax=Anaeromicrobium sp. TaxID=1929132 RepID=UPI0025FE011C|nr:peptidylprolyl isomerase [Anaeromicrobium sp.]MCT4593217.1 peptidylprolyl isomerase [Anaeromicrobium sp.]
MINFKVKRFIKSVCMVFVMAIFITACTNEKISEGPKEDVKIQHPKVQIEMKDGSKMVFELYPEYAPTTVENFISLSKSEFYDGLKFHRIMKGFMIQGGDPKGDGTGGSKNTIKGEFAENGFSQNELKHTKGIISMARSNDPNSASSQFFIMDGDGSFLDGKYAAFGKLIDGEDTLDKIADTPVKNNPYSGEASTPKVDVVIKKVIVLEPNN